MYEVDYSLLLPEYGVMNIMADDPDEAEAMALLQLKRDMPDAKDIEIEMVRKI